MVTLFRIHIKVCKGTCKTEPQYRVVFSYVACCKLFRVVPPLLFLFRNLINDLGGWTAVYHTV